MPYVDQMRTAKTISITLPPDLLAVAQEIAQREHRTMSELFREALRQYTADDSDVLQRFRAGGSAAGVTSEDNAERLVDAHRRERRGGQSGVS